MIVERGVSLDHSTIYRWVQKYAPEIEKRLRWDRGRVARPFGFALTDPGRRLSRTRLFPEVTRIGPFLASRGE